MIGRLPDLLSTASAIVAAAFALALLAVVGCSRQKSVETTTSPIIEPPKPRRDERSGIEFVYIEAPFGSFWLSRTEVTNDQFSRFMSDHNSGVHDGFEMTASDFPVTRVSHVDAEKYCAQFGFRLPTVQEWIFAFCGRDAKSVADVKKYVVAPVANLFDETASRVYRHKRDPFPWMDGYATLSPVGTFPSELFGTFDMLGNVSEWCRDIYAGSHVSGNPPPSGVIRSVCGGSFLSRESYLEEIQLVAGAWNIFDSPTIGFRVVDE